MPSISDILTQNSNDKVEIKSQVNLNGESFKTFKQFIEQFGTYEVATKFDTRTLSASISIYGNSAHATYGTSRYNDSYTNSLELARVIPPNRTFVDRFVGTAFVNSSSTATVSGDTVSFTTGEYLQSEIIYKDEETISSAKMSTEFVSGESNLSSYISADNGVSFTEVTNNTVTSIGTPGEDVIYKLVASGNAEINKLEVVV